MTREDHLEFCKICVKRKFNSKKGIVCSLTDEWADFDTNCINFEEDLITKKNVQRAAELRAEQNAQHDTFGLSEYGIKNGIAAGIVIIAVALVWLIAGLKAGWIFYYPIIMLIVGIVALIKGIVTESRKIKKRSQSAQ